MNFPLFLQDILQQLASALCLEAVNGIKEMNFVPKNVTND